MEILCIFEMALQRITQQHSAFHGTVKTQGAKAVLVGTLTPPRLPFGVLESKLRVPSVPPEAVSRTALVNRLRAAGAFPLVIVVAPAGYGKTMLLSQWANRDAR